MNRRPTFHRNFTSMADYGRREPRCFCGRFVISYRSEDGPGVCDYQRLENALDAIAHMRASGWAFNIKLYDRKRHMRLKLDV